MLRARKTEREQFKVREEVRGEQRGECGMKRDTSESELETSDIEAGGSPNSHNTVLHTRRQPRDLSCEESVQDVMDVTCLHARTSTPHESLVKTSKRAKNRMCKSLRNFKNKGKKRVYLNVSV